jgi:hypothetical protein
MPDRSHACTGALRQFSDRQQLLRGRPVHENQVSTFRLTLTLT